jgi:hypothetical protein
MAPARPSNRRTPRPKATARLRERAPAMSRDLLYGVKALDPKLAVRLSGMA